MTPVGVCQHHCLSIKRPPSQTECFVFVLNLSFCLHDTIWIHCCLLICPLILSEAKQSINNSIEGSSEPCVAYVKVLLHAMNG